MTQRYFSSTAGLMTLQSTISAAATSISVNTVVGLPGSTPFTLVIDPSTSLEEIVDVTSVAGTVLTIVRGVDGSPATAHTVGAAIRHMASGRDFREANTHVNATSGVHGLTGPLLGTTDTQAVFNKDLTSATNTFPTSLATAANLTAHTAASTGVHGITGAVVGTTDTQTLTNKTLSYPIITGTMGAQGANFSGNISAPNLPFGYMQKGSVVISVANGANFASAAVTFPTAFAGAPMVFVSIADAAAGTATLVPRSYNPTASGVTVYVYTGNNPTGVPNACSVTVNWLAMY